MSNDIVIQIWHHGSHWSLKKNGEQYWHRGKNEIERRSALPSGMTLQDAARAFREG